MTAPTIPPADLLTQLGDLITATQAVSADAGKWRELLDYLREMGYGPRIDPLTIARMIPRPDRIAEIAAASQEVPAATPAPKSAGTGKRRTITEHDREIIRRAHADGLNIPAISQDFGYSKSTIERALHPDNGDAA